LVKKTSKKNFPPGYQRATAHYDYGASGTTDNQFGLGG
jgi:hypothetical protein